jgi:hypothetical protein
METYMIRRNEREIGSDTPPTEAVNDIRRMRRPTAAASAVQPERRSSSLRRTLESRRTLRQAILLQDILGPPVALRRGQQNK